ncbi:MAG: YcxB family protein [Bacilli bacterium]
MKNISPFTKAGYLKMHKVTSGKIVWQTIVLDVIALLIGIIFIIQQQYVLAIVTFLVIVGFSIAIPLNRHFKIKKLVEAGNDLYDNVIYEFEFGEEEYKCHYKYIEEELDASGKYSDLYKIIDTPEYIYLFVNVGVAYIVNKNGFEEKEDAKKLTNILRLKNPHYFYKGLK